MITLNMQQKNIGIAIPNTAFSLENQVVTLEIKVVYGDIDYDLTGMTITANFDRTELETIPLDVVNGYIQLPISNGMIMSGYNVIQLNFRLGVIWEQSPTMTWRVYESVETTAASDGTVDIITYLISENNKAIDAEKVRVEAETLRVTEFNGIKDNVNLTIQEVVTAKNGANTAAQTAIDTATNLETTYAPRLTTTETLLAEKATQLALEVEKNRITNLATLAVGSTTGDAELIDGRVGANGIVYASIGEANRVQLAKNQEIDNDVLIDCAGANPVSGTSYSQRSFVENTIKVGYKLDSITIVGAGGGYAMVELWTLDGTTLTQVYSQQHPIVSGNNVIALNYVAEVETYLSIRRAVAGIIMYNGTKTGVNYYLYANTTSTTLDVSSFTLASNSCLPVIAIPYKNIYALERAKEALGNLDSLSTDVDVNYYKLEKNKVYTKWDDVNKVLTIYKKCTETSSYIGYNFEHKTGAKDPVTPTTWYDVWRLRGVFIYTKNTDGTFTKSFPYTIVHEDSEWECAIKEAGQVDFVGGSIHGDEIINNIVFMLDGIGYTDASLLDGKVCYDFRIFRTSSIYRCNTLNAVKIADHYADYEFSANGILINQRVKWLVNTTCDKSYLAMLGAKRLLYGYQITSKALKEGEGVIYDVSIDGFTNDALTPFVGSKKAYLYNDKANLQTSMSVEILESNRADNSTLAIQNTANYNKVYLSFCEEGYNVSIGDEWKNKALYKLDYFGMIS